MRVLSLGWGVQSFTLAAMVALGELKPVDYAIHADTTHERSATYDFAKRWTPWLQDHWVKVITVQAEHPQMVDKWGGMQIPAFTVTPKGNGQVRRQCTHEWKIRPLRKRIQELRQGETVELWIGISLDEFQRMKDADVRYITHRWPLIEKRMTRKDCQAWLVEHGLEVPGKSACVFCPFQSTQEWHDLKTNGNGDWTKAVEVDESIRQARPPYDLFLHPARKPLTQVDFRTAEEKGQLSLWDTECSGICGI